MLQLPDFFGGVGCCLLAAALILALKSIYKNGENFNAVKWGATGFFAALALVLNGVLVLQWGEERVGWLALFSSIPWVLAAGLTGPVGAVVTALAGGLVRSVWMSHQVVTALSAAGVALLFSLSLRQRYRTVFYRFLRHPAGSSLYWIVFSIPFQAVCVFIGAKGDLAARLDASLGGVWSISLGVAGELLIAGFAAELIYLLRIKTWGEKGPLVFAPHEVSMRSRFNTLILPLLCVGFLAILALQWGNGMQASRDMVEGRLRAASSAAAGVLQQFERSGKESILSLAGDGGVDLQKIGGSVFFRSLKVIDRNGKVIDTYPAGDASGALPEEIEYARGAVPGAAPRMLLSSGLDWAPGAVISFVVPLKDGILAGRTDLGLHPLTAPMVSVLGSLQPGEEGTILDAKGRIVFASHPFLPLSDYLGALGESNVLFLEKTPFQDERYVLQTRAGETWHLVITTPADALRSMALRTSAVTLGSLGLAAALLIGLGHTYFFRVSSALDRLSKEAALLSRGQMDHAVRQSGVDEIGRLELSFERMRQSLKGKLENEGRLLSVSQGVAANLEVEETLQPVLQALMMDGVAAARIVLTQDVSLLDYGANHFQIGTGPSAELYAYLDTQIFDLAKQQDFISIPNTVRLRRLQFHTALGTPAALAAVAIREDHEYFGALWVAYHQPHVISEEETDILNRLAAQAAAAAANGRLYAVAERSRQRLEAVLSSLNEPILVMDEKMRLLFINPAAINAPGLVASASVFRPVREVVVQPELLEFLMHPQDGKPEREIHMGNLRVYQASVTAVSFDGRQVGRVCILRDITLYKELDKMKSEFVTTVSHDLRAPLTLMHGYATMLDMVGELNTQQVGYVKKILGGVDTMSHLVNNLLNLGRIEAGINLQIEKVSATEVINNVITQLLPQANQKSIKLIHEIPQQPVIIQADMALLQQAMINLVENAIKYTPVGGQVGVRLQLKSNSVVFEVSDSGIGIAPLDLPHVFDSFYRSGQREAYRQRGSGLGLAIVKSIAERHHGKVGVDSVLGKYSTFTLEVPFTQK